MKISSMLAAWLVILPFACTTSQTPIPEQDAPAIELTATTWPEFREQLGSGGPLGRGIVVIDFWSTACAPCMKEFPGLVSMAADHPEIRCVSFCVDFDGRASRPAEGYRDKVTEFLSGVDATPVKNFLSTTPIDQVLESIEAISIPAVQVYRDGDLVQTFVDADDTLGFTYQTHVRPKVESMLAGE